MVTFLITMFEIVMLVFQVIYFLERPGDKGRLQYLVLLVFLIAYNVCGGLFPDPMWLIPIALQTILAYLVGFTMSMYVVYYFYKVFDLQHLKFFATYGLVLFLFVPFLFLFIVPFLLTGDALLSSRLTVIIPFLYGVGFIYYTARALKRKFSEHKNEGKAFEDPLYEHAIAAYISMVCWASLPVIVFFGDFQVLEHSVTNAGFLMMTIIYVRSSIKQSRREYAKLLESERNLLELTQTLKRKVRARTKKLENAMEARKATFINLAHETKTPLTLINNYLTEYVNNHGETEEITVVKNNIKRLTNDIVNFFDVECYERGFSMYNHDRVSNFTSLLNDKLSLFKLAARKKGIQLFAKVHDGIYVKAHPGAVERIVNNLLENAIKYCGDGSSIEIGLIAAGSDVTFYVKDTGPGIPGDQRDKIFQPYYKLSVSGRNSQGMGMGLAIVKKIVADIRGRIRLTSEIGQGTNIELSLPIAHDQNAEMQVALTAQDINLAYHQILLEESLDDEKPFVLVVEDNLEMLNLLRNKLKAKYNVAVARNGKEALQRLSSLSTLDLIISDIMMFEMDGYVLRRTINDMDRYAHIPFIFLSARGTSEERLAGLNMGAVAYIQKPFNVEELLAKVGAILTNFKRHREAFVSKAYQAVMSEANSPHTTGSVRPSAFADNCKKYRLTSREVEIIRLLIKGIPYKVISAELSISEKTVTKHMSNIFLKVEVNNKIELISRLEAQELIGSSPLAVNE